MKIIHNPDVGPLREKEYPEIGDQLDAIWKLVDALSVGKTVELPKAAQEMLDRIKEVKQKYASKVVE